MAQAIVIQAIVIQLMMSEGRMQARVASTPGSGRKWGPKVARKEDDDKEMIPVVGNDAELVSALCGPWGEGGGGGGGKG